MHASNKTNNICIKDLMAFLISQYHVTDIFNITMNYAMINVSY